MGKTIGSLGKGFAAGHTPETGFTGKLKGATRTSPPASKTSSNNGEKSGNAHDSFTHQIGPRGDLHTTKDQAC